MPLLTGYNDTVHEAQPVHRRKQSQFSPFARSAVMTNGATVAGLHPQPDPNSNPVPPQSSDRPQIVRSNSAEATMSRQSWHSAQYLGRNGLHAALNDTPQTSTPNSPNIHPQRQNSGEKISRARPTTLDIPGLTKSNVSPDGRIAQRDVGSKLVIVMVGLPARGKSYITKKMARYLNWLQHDTRVFNVGERRRVAASGPNHSPQTAVLQSATDALMSAGLGEKPTQTGSSHLEAHILVNGEAIPEIASLDAAPDGTVKAENGLNDLRLPHPAQTDAPTNSHANEDMDQSAGFFDPSNTRAAQIREQCAMDTLEELLDYILEHGGSVGILDATNSTLQRRKKIMNRIRERAGPDLNVLFLESLCQDESLLERNMSLKLSGPDYKGKDAKTSLADFKKRVAIYEKNYVSLGKWEEDHNMPYVQMIDVGRKVISHQIRGFLSAQAVYYLLNFNLAPRQIWLTRHGQSIDNVNGKIGGDAELSPLGVRYAQVLTKFVKFERKAWDIRQREKEQNMHLPPRPGDSTPPNPHYTGASSDDDHMPAQAFCVWTSMLKRSIETAQFFDDEEFDIKQMRMLDELNGGTMEGLTYDQIRTQHRAQYDLRKANKLGYRYPGPGGEGYLDVINRLRPVIVELERMTDHVLLIAHRAIMRVLLAYFKGLHTEEVATLDVPLGLLYCLEPKPYGVDFKAYRFNVEKEWFELDPDYQLQRAASNVEYE